MTTIRDVVLQIEREDTLTAVVDEEPKGPFTSEGIHPQACALWAEEEANV